MEDVLAVYARPYDEAFPVVCMDESCDASHNFYQVEDSLKSLEYHLVSWGP